jgi:2-desacetyl-2-hydroxyethyl bacteriochlorophyllide A dehydrogenase
VDFDRLKIRLRGPLRWGMELARIPPSVRPHLQDRLVRSVTSRAKSFARGGRMWAGTEVYWPQPGVADVGILEVAAPGPGEVLIQTDFTAVSPGTERAFLNFVPGVVAKFPLRPGYSGAGTVVQVGRGVTHVGPGARVACTETVPHASLAVVRAERVFPIPAAASAADAAFLQLAIIAQYGLRRGRVGRGERVVVVGAGLIAQLAARIARAWGAKGVAVVASSSAKRSISLASGADQFVDLGRDPGALDRLRADVVVEVTGSPDALEAAARAAAPEGRIVLLGSTRGLNRGVDFDALLRDRELSLVGAHISTLTDDRPTPEDTTYREEAHEALGLLVGGRLRIDSLITDVVNPLDAAVFYRRLCRGDHDIVGALLDWGKLDDERRCRRSFALLPPRDMLRKGRAYDQDEGPPSLLTTPPRWLVEGLDALPSGGGVLRFGLIGCGGMGARHAAAIRSAPNTELVATMDADGNLARDLAAGAFHTSRLEELLARPDVDAVLIATPNHVHDVVGIQAARAGKHVVMEKPMAQNLVRAESLLAACRASDVALSVGYCFRYAPEVRAARRIVERGLLGRLLSVQLTCYFDKPPAYYGSGRTGRTHSDWRSSREKSGGGVMIMNMSHQLDQIRFILGQDVMRVTSAVAGTLDCPQGVEVEDAIAAQVEFPGGAVGSLFGTCFARGLGNQVEIRILGEAGSLILDPPARFFTLHGGEGVSAGRWYGFGPMPKVDVHATYLAWFAAAVLEGRRPEIAGEDGLAVQAWMDAIYEAADTGRSTLVSLPAEPQMAASAAER